MVSKMLKKKIIHEIGSMNKRIHNSISVKIKNLSIEQKEQFIRDFTLSHLYKFVNTISTSSACNFCIENLKKGLNTNDLIKIGTFIELMNNLGWKDWKKNLDKQNLQLQINKKEKLKDFLENHLKNRQKNIEQLQKKEKERIRKEKEKQKKQLIRQKKNRRT